MLPFMHRLIIGAFALVLALGGTLPARAQSFDAELARMANDSYADTEAAILPRAHPHDLGVATQGLAAEGFRPARQLEDALEPLPGGQRLVHLAAEALAAEIFCHGGKDLGVLVLLQNGDRPMQRHPRVDAALVIETVLV